MSWQPYCSSAPLSASASADVQAGLAAEGRQDGVGPLDGDDLLDDLGRDRLDVGPVGHLGVGHDRGRVRVDQDDLVPLLAERLARLGARVVELARLADDDRPGADDQDLLDVGTLGHGGSLLVSVDAVVDSAASATARSRAAPARDSDGAARPGKSHDFSNPGRARGKPTTAALGGPGDRTVALARRADSPHPPASGHSDLDRKDSHARPASLGDRPLLRPHDRDRGDPRTNRIAPEIPASAHDRVGSRPRCWVRLGDPPPRPGHNYGPDARPPPTSRPPSPAQGSTTGLAVPPSRPRAPENRPSWRHNSPSRTDFDPSRGGHGFVRHREVLATGSPRMPGDDASPSRRRLVFTFPRKGLSRRRQVRRGGLPGRG